MDGLSERAARVLAVLSEPPLGRWTREQLAERTEMADRSVREGISELRNLGIAVVSDSQAAGYWLARSAAEVRDLRAEYESRIRAFARTCRQLRSTERAMREGDGRGEPMPAMGRLM